jgi:hypothetical protein
VNRLLLRNTTWSDTWVCGMFQMMGDALPARDPEQLHQVQPAWVERTSPVNNQGKATYRCLVPGCGKLWSRAVVPGVANNHVKEVHRGMKLRWTHLQSPLTSAQQLHNYMESTRQAKTKSKKKQEVRPLPLMITFKVVNNLELLSSAVPPTLYSLSFLMLISHYLVL